MRTCMRTCTCMCMLYAAFHEALHTGRRTAWYTGQRVDGHTYYGHTYYGCTHYGHTYYGHTYYGHTYYGCTYYGCTHYGIQASASMATALKGVNASASGLVVAAALILGQSYATSLPEQVASLTTAVQTMATLTTPMLTIAVLLLYWLWLHSLRLRRLTARAGHRHAVLLRHHFLRRAPGAHRLARLAPSRANVLGQRNLPFCIAFRMQRGVTRGAH